MRSSLSEQALEMARRIGDPETLAYALSGYNQANLSPEFTPKQVGWRRADTRRHGPAIWNEPRRDTSFVDWP